MAEQEMVNATRDDVDEAVFSACEDYAENEPGLSRRERMKLTLTISEAVMFNIDALGGAAKRSEAAKKAAQTRYAKPKPGPAIPPPEVMAVTPGMGKSGAVSPAAAVVNPPPPAETPYAGLPPPPHPALMPQGAPAPAAPAGQPFGAPPVG